MTTQNDGRCEVVPRLPREIKVDVTKCHACHAKVARHHADMRLSRLPRDIKADAQASPSAPPSAICPLRLLMVRKTTVDVRLCHACHAKSR